MRPPPWAWALPAAVGLGIVLGTRLGTERTRTAAPSPDSVATVRVPNIGAVPTPAQVFPAGDSSAPVAAETTTWGADGGGYAPLVGGPADTLPAAPENEDAPEGAALPLASRTTAADPALAAPPPRLEPARVALSPAQGLTREAALRQPLVAIRRGAGRVSFYSAWDAPANRASLVGEYASPGDCRDGVRLAYEQVAPGLGVLRGIGELPASPAWDVALVVPRQHCAAASSRWIAARPARPAEVAMLESLFPGERPDRVVVRGAEVWATARSRVVAAGLEGGQATLRWATAAPDGTSVRLLGSWDGEVIWVAVEAGGRIRRVSRGAG